jgi:hypothetical protein
MIEFINLAIDLGKIMFKVYSLGVKGIGANGQFSINRIFKKSNAYAIDISFTNLMDRPVNIQKIVVKSNDKLYEACRVVDVKTTNSSDSNLEFSFVTDMLTYDFENTSNEAFSLKPFDTSLFLQRYQSESGWFIVVLPDEPTLLCTIGFQLSGLNYITYPDPHRETF